MSKTVEIDPRTGGSLFDRRRRARRLRMIVDVTASLIQYDDSLTEREARCLIDCARKAIQELFPELATHIDATLRPKFERILHSRWPQEERSRSYTRELVN
jgi:hypothetical protein